MHTNCPIYIPVFLVLIVFGYVYNRLVERLENAGHDRGYMSLIVSFVWDRQMTQALDGNDQARETLAAIHDHIRVANCANQINLLLVSQLLTDAILSLDHSKSALIELRTIAEAQKRALAGGTATAGHLATGPARSAQPGEASPGDASPHQDQNPNQDKETDK